jgi:hypothetical protein
VVSIVPKFVTRRSMPTTSSFSPIPYPEVRLTIGIKVFGSSEFCVGDNSAKRCCRSLPLVGVLDQHNTRAWSLNSSGGREVV